ncbi:MAG: polysaccharide deacetylase family protein [Brevinematales bacterium]|jgi:peptidoglycan/xylan/chitin deacetylase (PgdA/CDA1 family)
MRFLIPLLFIIAFTPAAPVFADGKTIALCYHTFIGLPWDQYDFSPLVFSNQIASMKKLGYRFVSFQEMQSNSLTGNTNILITLDDGNQSVRSIFQNILTMNGIKPVLFIYPAIISRMHYALNYSDLQEYENDGAIIGAHGYYHLFVTEKLFKKDSVSFNREIYKTKDVLGQKLNTNISIFAYPFGACSDITVVNMKKAGYDYAFTIKPGQIKVPLSRNTDPYRLPRYLVTKASWKYIYRVLKNNARAYTHII